MSGIDVTLRGRAVADAELHESKNGSKYMTFRFVQNVFENNQDKPYWFYVTCYDSYTAEQWTPRIKKGSSIFIEGELHEKIYENRHGECDIDRNVRAYKIDYLTTSKKDDQQTASQSYTARNDDAPVIPKEEVSPAPAPKKTAPAEPKQTSWDSGDDELPF